MKEIWPLCETDGIIGAIQHPDDGYIQPADLTQALAKGARARGAEIYRHTTVTAIERTPNGEWLVQDRQGRHRLRARGLGHRQFRATDRRDGRARHPGHPGRAPVHRHRAASRGARAAPPGPARDGRAARGRFLLVPARGERRLPPRPLRDRRALLLCRRAGRPVRIRAVPGGPRPPRAAHRGGDRPRAGLRRGRRQEGLQRRHRLYARRQPDHRPGLGACRISGSTRATASASPPPAAPAGSSPNGSSRASRRST